MELLVVQVGALQVSLRWAWLAHIPGTVGGHLVPAGQAATLPQKHWRQQRKLLSRLPPSWCYVKTGGQAAVRVLRRKGPWLLDLKLGQEVIFAQSGASRLAVIGLLDVNEANGQSALAVLAHQLFPCSARTASGLSQVVELTSAGAEFGPVSLLNAGPTPRPSLAALSDLRVAVAYRHGSSATSQMQLRLGQIGGRSVGGRDLLWAWPIEAGPAPAAPLLALTPRGPLLLTNSRTGRWFQVWDQQLAVGKLLALPGADARGPEAPSLGAVLHDGTAALLLAQRGIPTAVQTMTLRWPCVLPPDTTGYDTSKCSTSIAPIVEQDCVLSCADGYLQQPLRSLQSSRFQAASLATAWPPSVC
ncbi:unnamed protein product [Polarella glacialis]|uniref:Uncharacterized protein n=1 Tax=Polarella glacialis TaxID=89957 RepID=A0A813JCH5_POLGL|nr:unnamed protein product [Polarella glacialis]